MNNSVFSNGRSWAKIVCATLIICVVYTFMPFVSGLSYGAVKPGKIKELEANATNNKVTLTWKKAAKAKKYVVQRGKQKKVWKYWKKVKKTKANKKKYTTSKYRVKASGKKYKVYRKQKEMVYKKVATVKKPRYKFKGEYSTYYSFRVYALNGKKKGLAATVELMTPEKPVEETVEKETVTHVDYPEYTVSVVLSYDNSITKLKKTGASTEDCGEKYRISTGTTAVKNGVTYRFVRWEAVEPANIKFDDPTAAETYFEMPAQDVTVKRCFEKVEE